MSVDDELLRRAVALHRSGELDEARALYERVLRDDERNPNALNLLGMVHHQQGRHQHAVELIERAIEAAPGVAGFHNNLGTVRLAQRRCAQAEQTLRRAVALQANYVEAINNLAVALMGQGRIDEAMPLLARCLELRTVYPSARNNLGNALRARRMYREAIACYSQAIEQKPDHADSWANLAIALLETRDLTSAETAARRAVALRPDDVSAYYTLGVILEAQKRPEEAVKLFRHVLRQCSGADVVRFHLASLTGEQGYAAAPPAFVQGLFDQYADTFEKHLLQVLNYRGPEVLCAAVTAAGFAGPGDVADLGCGTGLCGPLLRPVARTLVGVDLSPRMVHEARQRGGAYDELVVGDLLDFLAQRPDRFDLLLAADVLVYVGDLSGVFAAAARSLRVGGLFAFTLEKQDDAAEPGYRLHPTRRFTHFIGYAKAQWTAAGLTEGSVAEAVLRTNSGIDVVSWVVVLRKK
jgi:predicted TPR repeat methyltransferase